MLDRVVPPALFFCAMATRVFRNCLLADPPKIYTNSTPDVVSLPKNRRHIMYQTAALFFCYQAQEIAFRYRWHPACMAQENFLKKMVPVSWSVLFSLSLYLYTGTMERPAKVNVCIEKTVIFGRIYRRLCALLNPARACLRWQIFR